MLLQLTVNEEYSKSNWTEVSDQKSDCTLLHVPVVLDSQISIWPVFLSSDINHPEIFNLTKKIKKIKKKVYYQKQSLLLLSPPSPVALV